MHFAKLFTYPTGQLLVTLHDSEDEDASPFQVALESRHPSGVTCRMALGFGDEEPRDAAFGEFDEASAAKIFNEQQAMLQKMSA